LPKAKFFAERISSGTRQRKYLPSARPRSTRQRNALGKAAFAEYQALGKGGPSANFLGLALGKGFAEGIIAFAECIRHSAKRLNPVMHASWVE
jgi:hypothetical protein